jgi:glutamate racemase
VIVIKQTVPIGKVIMPEVRNELDKTEGYLKVIEGTGTVQSQCSVELIKKTKTKLN